MLDTTEDRVELLSDTNEGGALAHFLDGAGADIRARRPQSTEDLTHGLLHWPTVRHFHGLAFRRAVLCHPSCVLVHRGGTAFDTMRIGWLVGDAIR
jgi:hypothetical protein